MQTVRLTKARTFELDPNKKYLIQIKEGVFEHGTLQQLEHKLHNIGIKNFVIVELPKNQHLKIVEAA